MVVHAHGDNLDALKRYVPQLERIIGTVQCRPPPGLYNFGGFTDGDRCVFLAQELGAASIKLVGFDFEDEGVTPRKKKKLAWAKRLIDLALAGSLSSDARIFQSFVYEIENRFVASSATFSASCSASIMHKSLRLKCGHTPEVLIHRSQELEPLELLPSLARLHSLQGGTRV